MGEGDVLFLTFLGRYATQIMAAGVFVGLLLPSLATTARPLLAPALFCVLTLSLVSLDVQAIRAWSRRPIRLLLMIAWCLVACPVIFMAALSAIPLGEDARTAFVLFAAAPPITAIPAFAMMFGANTALATVILTLASLVAPVVLPLVALIIIGLQIDIAISVFATRLLLLLGGAVAAAALLRKLIGSQALTERAPAIRGLIVIAMLLLALAIMDGITAQLLADPRRVIAFASGVLLANLTLQLMTTASFWWLGRLDALTVGLANGYRNSILLVAVVGAAASPELILMAAAAQISVYILPAVQRPIFRAMGCRPA